MRTFFNIIWWFPYCGFTLALANALAGLFWCITVIGLPIGLGLLQMAKFQLAPHTHMLVSKSEINSAAGTDMNTAWKSFSLVVRILYIPFGLVNALLLALAIAANCLTLLGIANGIALAKTFSTVFNPVNKVCVPRAVGLELQRLAAQRQVDAALNPNRIATHIDPAPAPAAVAAPPVPADTDTDA